MITLSPTINNCRKIAEKIAETMTVEEIKEAYICHKAGQIQDGNEILDFEEMWEKWMKG